MCLMSFLTDLGLCIAGDTTLTGVPLTKVFCIIGLGEQPTSLNMFYCYINNHLYYVLDEN